MVFNARIENEQVLKISVTAKRKKMFCLGAKHVKFGDVSPLSSFSFDFRHLLQHEQVEQNYYLAGGENFYREILIHLI